MNITIIGGGTAAWISAYILFQNENVKNVVVIENSNVPIIGTGEGSTYILHPIINSIGEDKFFSETNSTYKLGIKFKNWLGKGNDYNVPLDVPAHTAPNNLEVFKEIISKNENLNNYYINANLMENELINDSIFRYSYHFDGSEIGQFFKSLIINDERVTSVDDEIISVEKNEGKISVIKSKTTEYQADFYIDCSGFKRVLNSELNLDWISFKDYLAVDTAIAFQRPPENFHYTIAQAMDSGWMWKIPKKNSLGCGYNFSSHHCTVDQAIDEVSKELNVDIVPSRIINFNSGYLNSPLGENYCFLGLSSAFLEPLEATSIHSTVQQAQWLCEYFNKEMNKDDYNFKFANMIEEFRDLIILHYRTTRRDTSFWEDEYNRDNIPERLQQQIDIFKSGNLECIYDYLNVFWWFPPAYNLGLLKGKMTYSKVSNRLNYE
jgi:tryptophan halogenase